MIHAQPTTLWKELDSFAAIRYLVIREFAGALLYDPGSISGSGGVFDFETFECVLLR